MATFRFNFSVFTSTWVYWRMWPRSPVIVPLLSWKKVNKRGGGGLKRPQKRLHAFKNSEKRNADWSLRPIWATALSALTGVNDVRGEGLMLLAQPRMFQACLCESGRVLGLNIASPERIK